MDNDNVKKFRVKKILKISLISLLIFFILLLIYGFVRILPKDIQYSNVTSSSFTVSWNTKSPTKGAVRVINSENRLPIAVNILEKEIFNDTRDVRKSEIEAALETGNNVWTSDSLGVKIDEFVTERVVTDRGSYYTHHIEVKGLDPEKEYSVMVGDGLLFLNSKNFTDQKSTKTLTIAEAIETPVPTYGVIKNANNEDLAIENLLAVTDGIVYFNYVEELSDERSNTLSSSLNEEGAWYIDISSAVDSEGELFFEKYSQTVGNIYGELYLDLGPLGEWKKRVNMNESSPVETIVINIPGYIEGEDDSDMLIRVNSSNGIESEVVKGVSASGCQFVAYCGGCVEKVDGVQKECACDSATLERRGCGGGGNSLERGLQELKNANASECSGGGTEGDRVKYGTDCKICQRYGDGSTYRWVSAENQSLCSDDKYLGGKIITPAQLEEASSEEETSQEEGPVQIIASDCTDKKDGTECKTTRKSDGKCKTISGNKVCINDTDTTKSKLIIGENNVPCENSKGCSCRYPDQEEDNYDVDPGEICLGKKAILKEKNDALEKTKADRDFVAKQVQIERDRLGIGGPCRDVTKGIDWGIRNERGICVKRTDTNLITPDDIQGRSCSEKDSTYTVDTQKLDGNGNTVKVTFECYQGKMRVKETNRVCEKDKYCGTFIQALDTCTTISGTNLSCQFSGEIGKGLTPIYEWSDKSRVINPVGALTPDLIKPGEECTTGFCQCGDKTLTSNKQVCPMVDKCRTQDVFAENVICNIDGNTCTPKGCDGLNINRDAKGQLDKIYTKKVYAEDNTPSEYIIDQTTGKVLDIEPGLYTIRDGEEFHIFAIESRDVEDGKGDKLVYVDSNENGIQDEGEKTLSEFSSSVRINAIKKDYRYELKEGFNFITIPFLPTDSEARTAAGLLKMINDVYFDPIYSIAKYDGKWSVVGENVEVYDSNDFQLVPGQGYIVKAKMDITINITGRPVDFTTASDNAPITFYPGWNLIGMYGSNAKQYTAKSLIKGINKYEPVDFTANNVSRWESDVQKYDGLQITNENGIDIEYGFDFPINTLQSYFVRILQGKGNWQPELK